MECSYFIADTRQAVAWWSGFFSDGFDICRQWPSRDSAPDFISLPDFCTNSIFLWDNGALAADACMLARHVHARANKPLLLLLLARNPFSFCLPRFFSFQFFFFFLLTSDPFLHIPIPPLSPSHLSQPAMSLFSNDLLMMVLSVVETSVLAQKVFTWVFWLYNVGVGEESLWSTHWCTVLF